MGIESIASSQKVQTTDLANLKECEVCTGCNACPRVTQDKMKEAQKLREANPSAYKNRSVAEIAGVSDTVQIGVRARRSQGLSAVGADGGSRAINSPRGEREIEKDERVKDRKPSGTAAKGEPESEVKDDKQAKPVFRGSEAVYSKRKDEDFRVRPNSVFEQAQRSANSQFNNLADLQRYHMMQRQNGIAQGNQTDFSLAARAKAAADQADMYKKQDASGRMSSALQQNHAKLQALIAQTIQQATFLRNTLSKERQEQKIIVQHKGIRADLPAQVTTQLKKIEKAIETVFRHSYQQMTERQQRTFSQARSGIQIVNRASLQSRKTDLHRENIIQNLRSVERAMRVLRSKETAHVLKLDRGRTIKLRPTVEKRREFRMRGTGQKMNDRGKVTEAGRTRGKESERGKRINNQKQPAVPEQQRNRRLENANQMTQLGTQRQARKQAAAELKSDNALRPDKERQRRTDKRGETRIITDRELTRELRSTGLRGKVLKAALRAAKAELKAEGAEARVKVMRNGPSLKHTKKRSALETRKIQNRNIQREGKTEGKEVKVDHKLSTKNVKEQGVFTPTRAKVALAVEKVKRIIQKSPVLSRMTKEIKKVQALAGKSVRFIKSLFSARKALTKKELKKLKYKKEAERLFKLQMWMESLKKKKKFRVKGYENGVSRESLPHGQNDQRSEKDPMEIEVPIDTALNAEEYQEPAT